MYFMRLKFYLERETIRLASFKLIFSPRLFVAGWSFAFWTFASIELLFHLLRPLQKACF